MENNHRHYYHHQWLLLHHQQQQQLTYSYPTDHLLHLDNNHSGNRGQVLHDHSYDDSYYPPGYRFCPTDQELVSEYLIKLVYDRQEQPTSKRQRKHPIHEVDIYKNSPEVITSEYPLGGVNKKNEWFFITPLQKKYPNGGRPSRSCAGAGYWKPTGKDTKIEVNNVVARKKCLEFFQGKPPGQKTNWKMHEYRIDDEEDSAPKNGERKAKKLCPALCRIYLNTRKKDKNEGDEEEESSEKMNENDNRSETGSNSVVNGADANTSQVPYNADGDPDLYFQSLLETVNSIDCGAFNPYYENGQVLYNFNNEELMNPYYENGKVPNNFNNQEFMNHAYSLGHTSNMDMASLQ